MKNFKEIQLRPRDFSKFLLNDVGFTSEEIVKPQFVHQKSNFAKREIFIYFK